MTTITAPSRPATGQAPARAFAKLAHTEAKLFLREPLAMFWGVIFPAVLLIVVGAASGQKPQRDLGNVKFIVVYTPVLMVFTLAILSLNALPAALASYREKGYLRRLSTTPVGAWRLVTAQLAINATVGLCAVILIMVVARIAFSVPLPKEVGGFILAVIVSIAAMLSLGVLIAALAPSQRIASVAGSLLFFPMMFFAGLWVPQAQMGATLRDISHFTPLGAAVPAVSNSIAGHWAGTVHLLVLAGYAVVLCTAAMRLFRWER